MGGSAEGFSVCWGHEPCVRRTALIGPVAQHRTARSSAVVSSFIGGQALPRVPSTVTNAAARSQAVAAFLQKPCWRLMTIAAELRTRSPTARSQSKCTQRRCRCSMRTGDGRRSAGSPTSNPTRWPTVSVQCSPERLQAWKINTEPVRSGLESGDWRRGENLRTHDRRALGKAEHLDKAPDDGTDLHLDGAD
jgi:hypothetical protein